MDEALLLQMPILPAVRVLAMATGFPLLAGPGAPMHVRLAIGAALCFILVPAARETAPVALSFPALLLALPFEFLLGLALGYLFTLVFHLLTVAGDFAGQEMGLNSASQIDPATGISVPLLARLFEALGLVAFAEAGGLDTLLRTVRGSFDLLPTGALLVPDRLGVNIAAASTLALKAGVGLALPVALALFLITIFTTVAARALPRLHVFDFALAVRMLIAIVLTALMLPRLAPAVASMSAAAADAVEASLLRR